MDRRALFFLASALISFALYPLADPAQRWVTITVGVTYVVLAALSALDYRSRQRE